MDSSSSNASGPSSPLRRASASHSPSDRTEVPSHEHPLIWQALPSASRPAPHDEDEAASQIPCSDSASRSHDATSAVDQWHDVVEDDTPSRPTIAASDSATYRTAPNEDASTEAREVRRNMLINVWDVFSNLTRKRRWILIVRMLIHLLQFIGGIVILALPSSLGSSASIPETCDPQNMFVFLTLHITRIFFSMPVDVYLGISPHRSPRARRPGSEGLEERERGRVIGSIELDRKISRISDLLGFCHIVLFIVGNYVTWTSIECSHRPADSRPLWITCLLILSFTYMIIVDVVIMIFLVLFFLPLLIALLRALGLAHRIPQRPIHPETGKITKSTIDEQSRLVYYTPAHEDTAAEDSIVTECVAGDTTVLRADPAGEAGTRPASRLSLARSVSTLSRANSTATDGRSKRQRWRLLFGFGSNRSNAKIKAKQQSTSPPAVDDGSAGKLKYPLYPIPLHRATCPICLCDFERIEERAAAAGAATEPNVGAADDSARRSGQGASPDAGTDSHEEGEVEPLRLLNCGHVMHKSCVDQWLTTVSGRCPVCQKPLTTMTARDGADARNTSSPDTSAT